MNTLIIGQQAPDFEILSDTGETFRLSAHKGERLLLYFYPQANTPACDDQNAAFSQHLAAFRALGIEPIGISPDPADKLQKMRKTKGLSQRLLSDPEHKAIGPYGVWGEKQNYGRTYMGLIRSTVLVEADGTIGQVWPNIRAKGHVDRLLKALG